MHRLLLLPMALAAMGGCHKKPPESLSAEVIAPPPVELVAVDDAPAEAPPAPEVPPAIFLPVYFAFDDATLAADQLPALTQNFNSMKDHPELVVQVAGHCDERGSTEYNLALGDRRANAVRYWLVDRGVAPGHVTTISYGEESPTDPGHDETAWARNRRDEVRPIGAQPVAQKD